MLPTTSRKSRLLAPPVSRYISVKPVAVGLSANIRLVSSQTNASPSPRTQIPVDSIANSPRLQRYAPRLYQLSRRTGVPLSTLGLSFIALHELTAVIPLVILFFVFQALGTGAAFVSWIREYSYDGENAATQSGLERAEGKRGWSVATMVGGWIDEGEKRVERVGKRYGILGYTKVEKKAKVPSETENDSTVTIPGQEAIKDVLEQTRKGGPAEGVANAIAAYVVVKALLPLRIGFSIAAAPAFARFALIPIRRITSRFGRNRTP